MLAERDEKLVRAGAKLTPAYFKRAYDLQDADLVEPSSPTTQSVAFAESDDAPDQDAIDLALDSLSADAMSADAQAMLAPLLKRVAKGAQPDELLGMLAELYPTMDAAGLQQRLARVIFTAKVWGCCMSDVNLAHAMSLPPQDAIAYFQRKGFAIIGTGKSYGKRPRRRHLPLPKSRAWTSCRTSATPWRKSWPKVRRQHGSGSSSRQCFRPRAGGDAKSTSTSTLAR